MTAALKQTITVEEAEHYLNLKGWGTWLKISTTDNRPLGYAQQCWMKLFRGGFQEGWKASPHVDHPIDEEYAAMLDRLIARQPEMRRDLLVMVYAAEIPITSIAKSMHMNRLAVRKEKEAAIWTLYGMLKAG